MEYSEKWGKDVEEAVELALKDLSLSREEVEIEVLEEPSKGFLGIGSKLAKVRVHKKENIEASQKEEEKNQAAEKVSKKISSDAPKEEKPREPVESHISLDFLRETTEKMGLELDFDAYMIEESLHIDIEGKDAGTIIGKRGQTLDAIQYLTSLVVNKEKEQYTRVVVDAEKYRAKREKTLEQLAERLAAKVVKTRRAVRLEPMNPYERMVIHATLQEDPQVTTRSEGEEPYRRVIIDLK